MMLSIVVLACHLATVAPPSSDDDTFSDPDGLRPAAADVAPPIEYCHEEVLAEIDLPMQACMMSQPQLAYWKEHSTFSGPSWRIAKWRCIPGRYVVRNAI